MAEMNLLARAYEFRWAIALAGVGVYILRKLRTYSCLHLFKGPFGTGILRAVAHPGDSQLEVARRVREVTENYGPRISIPTRRFVLLR